MRVRRGLHLGQEVLEQEPRRSGMGVSACPKESVRAKTERPATSPCMGHAAGRSVLASCQATFFFRAMSRAMSSNCARSTAPVRVLGISSRSVTCRCSVWHLPPWHKLRNDSRVADALGASTTKAWGFGTVNTQTSETSGWEKSKDPTSRGFIMIVLRQIVMLGPLLLKARMPSLPPSLILCHFSAANCKFGARKPWKDWTAAVPLTAPVTFAADTAITAMDVGTARLRGRNNNDPCPGRHGIKESEHEERQTGTDGGPP